MVELTFDRDRALQVVEHLRRGEPVQVRATRDDMLLVAGALFTAAMSQGPDGLRGVDPMRLPLEHREAHLVTLGDDLAWAVRWCAEMTRLAMVGGYDPLFDPVHQVRVDGGGPAVMPVAGVKEALLKK